ncbi:FAD-dependent oxidoreductase [Streptomyces chartreusis]|uniref:FAD-dependent oxidoreductase n=1 Tax=Streptomyces chartreusis TaxID=1969 RepID=UPI003403626C
MYDVVIVGAGPVGLWAALELSRLNIHVLVLERHLTRQSQSRAGSLHPRTLELFAARGLAEHFLREGVRVDSGHFAGLRSRLDFTQLDSRYPFTLQLPQSTTEAILEQEVAALGGAVQRGHEAISVEQGPDGVTVTCSCGVLHTARYLIGCDGARSTVRQAAGIEWIGHPDTTTTLLGDVVLRNPPIAALSTHGPEGCTLIHPLPDGLHRLIRIDPQRAHMAKAEPLTLSELRESFVRATGQDFGMHNPVWLSRVGNAAFQAASYRRGRIFLAGDSAHIHFPMGGHGLNLGIQDATNLSWKISYVLNRKASETILDTYQEERHPVGAAIVRITSAQFHLASASGPEGNALRDTIDGLLVRHPDVNHSLAQQQAGLDITYSFRTSSPHRLLGGRAPDAFLPHLGTYVHQALSSGSLLLLDFDEVLSSRDLQRLTDSSVLAVPADRRGFDTDWQDIRAALLRPDGHIAWLTTATDNATVDLFSALETWTGPSS